MEPINNTVNEAINPLSSGPQAQGPKMKEKNPLFLFMGIGSLVYAFFYTLFLYQNGSGITYPFFVGGTCLFFFCYLKKSGIAARKFSAFLVCSLILLGISTCLTDSWILLFFNKLGIFLLFFYMVLHNLYQDKSWDLAKYAGAILHTACTGIIFLFRPFTDLSEFLKDRKRPSGKPDGKGRYVLLGILIALPLLLVVTMLLCYADAVFSNIVRYLFSDMIQFLSEGNIWGVGACFLFAFFASYCLLCRFSRRCIREEAADKRTAEPLIGITFTGLISFVYLIFCFIQMVYLFGRLGTLPENYTYARYAREGFFQLVSVCIINLALVLICNKRFRRNKILKSILVFISLCTYIMIASSAYRMVLYIQAYHLTFLRILVLWGLMVIFLLISGSLALIFRESFPMVKYCVASVTVMYLFFSFAHPDYWTAHYNLSHAAPEDISAKEVSASAPARSFSDFYYLESLSMDAAPAIYAMADESEEWLRRYSEKVENMGWTENPDGTFSQKQSVRKFNFSRWLAFQSYAEYCKEHGGIPQ